MEVTDLLKIETLNLQANNIDDDALIELCDRLLNIHNNSLQRLVLEQTKITDRGVSTLIDTMAKITTLASVECATLKLSKSVRDRLKAACVKNQCL
jgi:hypothetical protein